MKQQSADDWDEGQLINFLARTGTAALSDLKQTPPGPTHRLVRLRSGDEYRRMVFAHPIAQLLTADARFRKALKLFDAKRQKVKTGPIADSLADIRFLHIVATVVGSYRLSIRARSSWNRSKSRENKSALLHAQKLAKLMENGVRMSGGQRNYILRGCLDDLVQELGNGPPAKPGPNRTEWQRGWLRRFVRELLNAFGCELPAKIIIEIAAMIDYEPDETAIARLIRDEFNHLLQRY